MHAPSTPLIDPEEFRAEWNAQDKDPRIEEMDPHRKGLLTKAAAKYPLFLLHWRKAVRGARQNPRWAPRVEWFLAGTHWRGCMEDYSPERDWRRHECPIPE